ncbi:Nodulin MtN21 /EamA-like transporter family protein, putative isoform 1 [Hibiscus syriacus]|uniref:Nodulin MtN21 /EamA-like transporter family protein, putative isoform 1 n=1 Tax=Hibiscus syriacus TaxID=106335 RepID=A0A6A3BX75_HIBSY|nr:Nodulin MtN21 /EamA-like transporter family protein, putative isoform 1 [Hibiscus syriacus]
MGCAVEGACVCCNFHTDFHCYSCCYECHFPRRSNLSWKIKLGFYTVYQYKSRNEPFSIFSKLAAIGDYFLHVYGKQASLSFGKRKTAFPPLKFPLFSRLCLLGIIGVVGNICGSKAVQLGSPTLASAISNLTPAFTFVLAVSFRFLIPFFHCLFIQKKLINYSHRSCIKFHSLKCYFEMLLVFEHWHTTRMERVEIRRAATQAKIIGTITSISGAFVIIFFKGPKVISSLPWTSSSSSVPQLQSPLGSTESNWFFGGILGVVSNLLFSFWCIIQAQVMKIYADEIVVTFLYNLSIALLALPVCIIAEPQLSSWRLTSSVSVVSVLYTGLFAHSFSSVVHTWGVRLKGPLFVATFKPASIVIAAMMGAIFLGEALYLGSVIGALIITGGLYAVLWGKAKEAEEMRDEEHRGLNGLGSSSSGRVPLLQSYKN